MTDHSQLVELNDLARDIPRMIDNAGTASQNTSLVDDAVTREAITLNVAAPFLAAVSERDQVIDALQARVAELEAGLRPYAEVAKHDIGTDEADADLFTPMRQYNLARRLTVGDLRRARALLERKPS